VFSRWALPREVIERDNLDQAFVLVQDEQPPYSRISASTWLAIVGVTGNYLGRHGPGHPDGKHWLARGVRSNRNIAVGDYSNDLVITIGADDGIQPQSNSHISKAARMSVSDAGQGATSRIINCSTFISHTPWSPCSRSAEVPGAPGAVRPRSSSPNCPLGLRSGSLPPSVRPPWASVLLAPAPHHGRTPSDLPL